VQQRLLPQARPLVPTLDYVGFCHPALRVGGDYYDYLDLPDGELGLVLADVSGKGASAALVMASLYGCIRAHAANHGARCAQVVSLANGLLHAATEIGRYATLFYAVYNSASRELSYVNAGHPPAIVARGRDVLPLGSASPPIGLFDRLKLTTERVQLQPGDRLLIYSDGLTEAMNPSAEEFGHARLADLLVHSSGTSSADLRDEILMTLRAHTGGGPQSDDVTFIAGVVR
jgi:sigma-B regulation protein RsbU (phosphoserine phosphatase)